MIGDRGLGGFGSLMLGSVALHTTAHAACPVLVVCGREHATRPVVVGVDDSAGSTSAVGFAIEEAARRQTGLHAVHAWGAFDSHSQKNTLPQVYEPGALRDEEHSAFSKALAGWGQRSPEVAIQQELVRGQQPAAALIERSQAAQLLVTGPGAAVASPGCSSDPSARTVLHHAGCPVAVTRTSRPAA
ncbi:universal stress protein [Micromonosporaceae bacterium Da 78-11]